MLDPNVVAKLKERYPKIHPLLFHRSFERAKSNGDLFDILETVPERYPLIWDENLRQWITTEDILLSSDFRMEKE